MRKWHNASTTEPARFIYIVVSAEPFKIPGMGKMVMEKHVAGREAEGWEISEMGK
jgi:hypothetical protein